ERKHCYILPGMGWNYYHWLLETVPLLRHYPEAVGDGEKPPLALFFPLKKWHLETLRLLGMGDVDLLPYEEGRWFRYECAWLPEFASHCLVPSPEDIEFLRERLAKPAKPKAGKKVFLTRRGVSAIRTVKGRKALEEKYRAKGFDVLDPSRMSLGQQIEFFSDADVVVAEGGAALANMVFCPNDAKFIIYSGDRAWAETFTMIASVLGQEVEVHLGQTHPVPNPYYLWTAFDVAGLKNLTRRNNA
ncbi:MAG: glycosyltransferase family 61 protein, partial [Gammaproteobacteria bacterium]